MPCDLFLRVRSVCFSPFRDDETSFDLFSFRLDEVVGWRFGFLLGSEFEVPVVETNPETGSCLIDFLMRRSIAANFLRS